MSGTHKELRMVNELHSHQDLPLSVNVQNIRCGH